MTAPLVDLDEAEQAARASAVCYETCARTTSRGARDCDCTASWDMLALVTEVRRLHTWAGLMSLLDEHYPADVFAGTSGDPGPTIVALLREISRQRERAT